MSDTGSNSLNKHTNDTPHDEVVAMFDNIAPRYDRLNRILSLSIDKRWRKSLIKQLKGFKSENILDLAAGTGDLSLALCKLKPNKIIAADPSTEMLNIAKKKFLKKNKEIDTIICSAEKLPFSDQTFDIVSIAFGIRNFSNPDQALLEIHRVLKTDGILAILEFGMPNKGLFSRLYQWYFRKILPSLGRLISKHYSAYSYLPQTVASFPYGKSFEEVLKNNAFSNIQSKKLSKGIAFIYTASVNK